MPQRNALFRACCTETTGFGIVVASINAEERNGSYGGGARVMDSIRIQGLKSRAKAGRRPLLKKQKALTDMADNEDWLDGKLKSKT